LLAAARHLSPRRRSAELKRAQLALRPSGIIVVSPMSLPVSA